MSRPLRIEYEGAWYHVMNRGRARDIIFPDDGAYSTFLETLAEVVERFRIEVHAYCLMPNHYENVDSHLRDPASRDQRRIEVVGRACREVAQPLLFAITIIVVVFFAAVHAHRRGRQDVWPVGHDRIPGHGGVADLRPAPGARAQ